MIRIGILGYGNLGRGVELALKKAPDMEGIGIFTRRSVDSVKPLTGLPVYPIASLPDFRDKIDVLILCGGSANDLPSQTPYAASMFHTVDSFDTHARIPEHFDLVDQNAKAAGKAVLISAGWDPGMFSLMRLYSQAILPDGSDYTFWGKGVSQGHSDAIRRIDGVLDARQYTIPIEQAVERVRSGENPILSTGEKHLRECFVVAKEGADKKAIEQQIVTMPNYFADYHTTVHFITAEEMARDHAEIPHGGSVIRSGMTGEKDEHRHVIEYRLKLDSNPEFTAGVLVAAARGVFRMAQGGYSGAMTLFDIPPAYLHPQSGAFLRKNLL